MFRIEFKLKSGSEWLDLGREYKTEKARSIALETLRKGTYSETFIYREAKEIGDEDSIDSED